MSFVDKEEARNIALDIMHQKYSKSCGNNFSENIILTTISPLNVSHVFGIDKSGHTFVSNNGKCEVTVYIYTYWGGYESFMEFNPIKSEKFNKIPSLH